MSEISNAEQFKIMMSEYMYSQLLDSILQNENNNNVIIDTDKKSGMVYVNHNDKYISMKSKQIVEKSMEKLNEQLNIINKNNKEGTLKDVIRYSRQIFNKKFIDFGQDEKMNSGVTNVMCDIYQKHKEKAQNMAYNVVQIENIDKQQRKLENKKKKKIEMKSIYGYSESESESDTEKNKFESAVDKINRITKDGY